MFAAAAAAGLPASAQNGATTTVANDATAHDLHTFKEALVLRPRYVAFFET